MSYNFTVNTTEYSHIHEHLERCSDSFIPPLESTVDLDEYTKKIIAFAKRFEAWENDELIGLVAVYMNDLANGYAFITNVSVNKAHGGQGIAKRLLEQCIEDARKHGFKTIGLEVSKENQIAIALYKKLGFIILAEAQEVSFKLALQLT